LNKIKLIESLKFKDLNLLRLITSLSTSQPTFSPSVSTSRKKIFLTLNFSEKPPRKLANHEALLILINQSETVLQNRRLVTVPIREFHWVAINQPISLGIW